MKAGWIWLWMTGLSGCVTYYEDAKGYPVQARTTAPHTGVSSQRMALANQYMRHERWDWALFHWRHIQHQAPDNAFVAAAIAQCLAAKQK